MFCNAMWTKLLCLTYFLNSLKGHTGKLCAVFDKRLLQRNYTRLMVMSVQDNRCLPLMKRLDDWSFSEPTLIDLPLDKVEQNSVRENVKGAIFSKVLPSPLSTDPKLVAVSEDVLVNVLNMDPSIADTKEFLEFVHGSRILPHSIPLAHRYGGHQFGIWAEQLGDGRAHLLGEYINRNGERWELQLKGSGKTPYSRDGDGRAVLRSSIREFLASEAMHYLGVFTSRAAALVVSGDHVLRDQFYNGNVKQERTAVVLRVAPSWFRFGSLEILAMNQERKQLKQLTDFIIREYFQDIDINNQDRYVFFFNTVATRTIDLILSWMSFGFVHGVLNTDNMSILGFTLDYGPFGFMDECDRLFVPNSSDTEGRYTYEKQIEDALWNLEQLSLALAPLLTEHQKKEIAMAFKQYVAYATERFTYLFSKKLGVSEWHQNSRVLIHALLLLMEETGADFTMTFWQLGEINIDNLSRSEIVKEYWSLERLSRHDNFRDFVMDYRSLLAELKVTDEERKAVMKQVNPRYVLRNWMAQKAIEKAEKDDFSEVNFLLKVLKDPYIIQSEADEKGYADPVPRWAKMLRVSCSS